MDPAPRSAVRVLLVDDEPDQIEMYRYGLEHSGLVILEANDGPSAIAQARSAPPDVIVLDLRMPDMDGWQVCAALKADSRTADIPIVILTAAASATLARNAARAGCAAHLVKPCYPTDLADTLRAVVATVQPKFGV
jgi:CheY-like chemotaxis protein